MISSFKHRQHGSKQLVTDTSVTYSESVKETLHLIVKISQLYIFSCLLFLNLTVFILFCFVVSTDLFLIMSALEQKSSVTNTFTEEIFTIGSLHEKFHTIRQRLAELILAFISLRC